ncbi:MAG: hypothetical protein H6704_10555 [Myxococcales bacterium]|nr:hypothetical protein [Myxococcales bacterium]MCB9536683.1 hypothetical protein [Myxococcales bacterium]
MSAAPDEAFRPYGVQRGATTLILARPRRLGDVVMRASMYFLILCCGVLAVLMIYAQLTRSRGVKGWIAVGVFSPMLLFVARLCTWGLTVDGVKRIEIGPDGCRLLTYPGFGRVRVQHVPRADIRNLVAREEAMRPRASLPESRWLRLQLDTVDEPIEMGWLAKGGPQDPLPLHAAAELAERLGVPLIRAPEVS